MDMCETCAKYMLRDSTMYRRMCGVCAEVCDACAKSCEGFPDHDVMRRCAEECRRCAIVPGDGCSCDAKRAAMRPCDVGGPVIRSDREAKSPGMGENSR